MKYYEVLFKDSCGICIRSEVENPTRECVGYFLKDDMRRFHYTLGDIESIEEISLEEARCFYDMENENEFPVLKIETL